MNKIVIVHRIPQKLWAHLHQMWDRDRLMGVDSVGGRSLPLPIDTSPSPLTYRAGAAAQPVIINRL